MPPFWRGFYLRQCLLLAACALGLALLFHGNALDLRLSDPWFDRTSGIWPARKAWWAAKLVHGWLRYVFILGALACVIVTWRRRRTANALRWRLVGASALLVPLGVTLWKRTSPMHCPWDISNYGGFAPYFDLFSATPPGLIDYGHCFPAGFVSVSSWTLAFALLRYPEDRRFSGLALAGALLTSLFFGFVQIQRGAHFLSHVLWTIWLSWTTVVLLHALLGAWREPVTTARPE